MKFKLKQKILSLITILATLIFTIHLFVVNANAMPSPKYIYDNGKIKYAFDNNVAYRFWIRTGENRKVFYSESNTTLTMTVDSASNILKFPVVDISKISEGIIEKTYTDPENKGVDLNVQLSPVNNGTYIKILYTVKNTTNDTKTITIKDYWDTAIEGDDRSPIQYLPEGNGIRMYYKNTQLTAYFKDVYNVTNVTSYWAGQYSNDNTNIARSPTGVAQMGEPGSTFTTGDSACYYMWKDIPLAPNETKEFSVIVGAGALNESPQLELTRPNDGNTYYSGETFKLEGHVQDLDKGDNVEVKWAIDNGKDSTLKSFVSDTSNQNFSMDYTLPSDLTEGWHTLKVWVQDDKGGVSSLKSIRFYVNNFKAPAPITFSNVKTNELSLSFDTKGNAEDVTYEVYCITTGETFNLGTDNQLTHKDLDVNKVYKYKVRAKNPSGAYTAYSDVYSISTLTNQPISKGYADFTKDSVTPKWDGNKNPDGTEYVYEARSNKTGKTIFSGKTTELEGTIKNLPVDESYKLYVKALNHDNVSTEETCIGEIYIHMDTIPPEAEVTLNPSSWTNGEVVITLKGKNEPHKISYIVLPDGSKIHADTVSFVVSENGTYKFQIANEFGNEATIPVEVTNIDKEPPDITFEPSTLKWTNQNVQVKIHATDKLSGVKSIFLLPNKENLLSDPQFEVKENGEYTVTAEDNAGNKRISSIDIQNIDKEKPVHSSIIIVPDKIIKK
ncbi:Ig-like domain-containing protein [Bacillus sp. NPDC094106]|uniref:Ig-like domain-containing protein n=1 Tax=Bacillus sp. NPDC094106 TaxID=3363949 RepID=UPI0038215875